MGWEIFESYSFDLIYILFYNRSNFYKQVSSDYFKIILPEMIS